MIFSLSWMVLRFLYRAKRLFTKQVCMLFVDVFNWGFVIYLSGVLRVVDLVLSYVYKFDYYTHL